MSTRFSAQEILNDVYDSSTHSLKTVGTTITVAANDAISQEKMSANYVCDGVSDDVQINAALQELTNGGIVRISSGRFNIANPIVIPTMCSLIGAGMDATIINLSNSAFCDVIQLDNPEEHSIFQKVADFVITGNKGNNAAKTGTATAVTYNTITDSGASWGNFAGRAWVEITGSSRNTKAIGQIRKIYSNTATAITLRPGEEWKYLPLGTVTYAIYFNGIVAPTDNNVLGPYDFVIERVWASFCGGHGFLGEESWGHNWFDFISEYNTGDGAKFEVSPKSTLNVDTTTGATGTGTASSGAADGSYLIDTTQAWADDQFNRKVVRILTGTGAVKQTTVLDTTASTHRIDLTYGAMTDLVATYASNPSLTSASRPFVSTDVGALITIASGTNFIAGTYLIVAVNGSTATIQGICTTAAGGTSGVATIGFAATDNTSQYQILGTNGTTEGPKITDCKLVRNDGDGMCIGYYVYDSNIVSNELAGGKATKSGIRIKSAGNVVVGNRFVSHGDSVSTTKDSTHYPLSAIEIEDGGIYNTISGNSIRTSAAATGAKYGVYMAADAVLGNPSDNNIVGNQINCSTGSYPIYDSTGRNNFAENVYTGTNACADSTSAKKAITVASGAVKCTSGLQYRDWSTGIGGTQPMIVHAIPADAATLAKGPWAVTAAVPGTNGITLTPTGAISDSEVYTFYITCYWHNKNQAVS